MLDSNHVTKTVPEASSGAATVDPGSISGSIYRALWQDPTVAYAILDVVNQGEAFRFVAMNEVIAPLGFLPTSAEVLGKGLNIVFPAQFSLQLQQHCIECVKTQKIIEFQTCWDADEVNEKHWKIKLYPLTQSVEISNQQDLDQQNLNQQDLNQHDLSQQDLDQQKLNQHDLSQPASETVGQIMLAATDISASMYETQQIKAELAATKANAQTIFDQVQEAIFLHELTGEMIDVNQPALEMHGIPREDLLRCSVAVELARPDTPVHLLPELWDRAIGGETVAIEWPSKRAVDGTPLELEVVLQKVVLDGRDRIMACVRDITERKRMEAEQNRLLAIIDSTPDLVAMADAAGNNFYLNQAGRRIFGIPEEGSAEFHISEKMPPQRQEVFRTEAMPMLLEAGIWSGESAILGPSGEELPISQVIIAHKDETDQIEYISTIIRDIHGLKETEARLRDREQFLNSIYVGIHVVIFAWDLSDNKREFRCSGWNPACEEATGMSAEQVLGQTPDDVFGPEQGAAVTQNMFQCTVQQQPISYQEELVFDGASTWWDTRLNPIKDSDGKVYRVVGTTTDITALKLNTIALEAYGQRQAEQAEALTIALGELKQTQVQIVQSEKMSSLGQMVAGIAHEINNPVNFIHANIKPASAYASDLISLIEAYQQEHSDPSDELAELLEELDFDFIQRDFLELLGSMKTGTQRIREIVLSLRNFSRLDESDVKAVDIHEGIDSTLVILAHRLRESDTHQSIEVIKE